MDKLLGDSSPKVWLALASASFDISVLELLWTLARGVRVVLGPRLVRESYRPDASRALDISLFYFASQGLTSGDNIYRMLLEGAKFADQHGLTAVWTPERHFHEFGGSFPNPALTSAALAMITDRI